MGARFACSIQSYAEALAFLAGRVSRRLAHNTVAEAHYNRAALSALAAPHPATQAREPDSIGIRYHRTVIVRFIRSGAVVLDSGGWRTRTTRERVRLLLPPGLYLDPAPISGERAGLWILRDNRPGLPGPERAVAWEDGTLILPDARPAFGRCPACAGARDALAGCVETGPDGCAALSGAAKARREARKGRGLCPGCSGPIGPGGACASGWRACKRKGRR